MEDLNRLKVVVCEKKRTSKWLAEKIRVTPSTVSKCCTNSSQPDLGSLLKITDLLGVGHQRTNSKGIQRIYIMQTAMKHFILLLSLLPLLCSCSKSREEKAAIFAEKEVKKILNDASTYESVETKVDSAFASIYTDYDACVAASEISKLNEKIESIKNDYNDAKSSAAIWSNAYDALSKEEYRQAKDKMAELSNRLKKLNDEIANKKNLIVRRYKDINTDDFVGWCIIHRFRCANSVGYKSLCDVMLVTDEDFKDLKIRMLMGEDDPESFENIKKVIDGIIE